MNYTWLQRRLKLVAPSIIIASSIFLLAWWAAERANDGRSTVAHEYAMLPLCGSMILIAGSEFASPVWARRLMNLAWLVLAVALLLVWRG
jgi:hypothetical protein